MTATRRSRRAEEEAGGPGGTGGASIRGALLIAVAVVIGVVLLGKGFDTGFLPSTGGTADEEEADDEPDDSGDDGTTTSTSAPPTTHVQAQVRVIVLNGGGPQGAAGTSTTALATAGFTTLEAGNTDPNVPASIIYAAAGFEADAAAVATALGITAPPQLLTATPPAGTPAAGTVDVVVILGPDFVPVG